MHAVSNAINILNSSIDTKICKSGGPANSNGNNDAHAIGKCVGTTASGSFDSKHKLSELVGAYTPQTPGASEKVGPNTATTISKDTSALSREEKGVMSSVFAKVIEGAEIVEIRWMPL